MRKQWRSLNILLFPAMEVPLLVTPALGVAIVRTYESMIVEY
jgi:hypothetical protein